MHTPAPIVPPNRRILIVDDNEQIHHDFARVLCPDPHMSELDQLEAQLFGSSSRPTQPDFELTSAFQGQQALELVRQAVAAARPFALAFVDMRMPPGWDGLETIEHLWQVDPELQVVICTAYSDYSWADIQQRLGATDRLLILKKPFDHVEVLQLALALTTKWQLAQEAALRTSQLEQMVQARTAALERANRQLRLAQYTIDHANQAILWLDHHGRIIQANPAAQQILDRPLSDLQKLRFDQLQPPEAATPWPAFWDRVSQNQTLTFPSTCLTASGTQVPVEINALFFRFDEQPLVCLFLTDITQRQRLEQLERDRLSLRHALDAMEKILSLVSHELRTPLASARAALDLLLASNRLEDQQRQDFLQTVHSQILQMSETINNVLEAARLHTGQVQWNWDHFDLAPLCQEALNLVQPSLQPGVQLEADIPANENLTMLGDSLAILRAIVQLLTNAAQHTSQGSIRLQVRLSADPPTRWIHLQVSDTGSGIPPQILHKLGQPFALGRGAVGQDFTSGAGLGLAFCQAVAAAHGGSIHIRSQLNHGTQVLLRLRADLPHPSQDPPAPIAIHTPDAALAS